jgi:hypothetical protein
MQNFNFANPCKERVMRLSKHVIVGFDLIKDVSKGLPNEVLIELRSD